MTGGGRGRTGLERKLAVAVAGLCLVPTALAVAGLLLARRRGVLDDPDRAVVVVAVGFALVMAALGLVAHALGRLLVGPIRDLQHGTELMASVNPAHRHRVAAGHELEALAAEINRLADRLAAAHRALDDEARRATAALAREHRLLVETLEGLREGVVVVALDGTITLVNRRGRELLDLPPGAGLGTSLFDRVDRAGLEAALAVRVAADGGPRPVRLERRDGRSVVARVAPLHGDGPAVVGAILTLAGASVDEPAPAGPAGGTASFVGAGLRSGRADVGPMPIQLYDFGYLDAAGAVPPPEVSRPLAELTCVVFDTETTGLWPARGDRVVSLAAVRVRGGKVWTAETLDALVRPDRAIPAASARIHGIDDGMVAGAPPLAAVLPAFLRFAEGAVLVGHEVWFDLAFLEPEMRRLGRRPLAETFGILDTHLLARVVHEGAPADLDALARRLGVTIPARHSALGDALGTAEVLVRLLPLLERRGVRTLADALDAARRLRRRAR